MHTTEDVARVVMVTGAARRVGAAIVRALHGAGYRVIVHSHRSGTEAAELADSLNDGRPDSVRLVSADLLDVAAFPELIASVTGYWGRLDGLVNNASSFYPTALGTVSEAEWDDLLGSNLKAPFFMAQAAMPVLRGVQGSIVNILDVYAERPLMGYPVYSIAKAGLMALTQALARELAPDIRVNGVAPGAILWPESGSGTAEQADILARIPLGRAGEPADIARAVLFFLRDAPYVTGQVIAVDGGRRLFI